MENRNLDMEANAEMVAQTSTGLRRRLENYYTIACQSPDGEIRWVDNVENLVVTTGLNDSLDRHLTGSGYTAAWYIGICSGTAATFAAGDTMSSHAGWTEGTIYSQANRVTLTMAAASGGSTSNVLNKGTFSINAAGTLCGAFITTDDTKGGTDGTLYGGGQFGSNRVVGDGDTLNVTIVCTASAS